MAHGSLPHPATSAEWAAMNAGARAGSPYDQGAGDLNAPEGDEPGQVGRLLAGQRHQGDGRVYKSSLPKAPGQTIIERLDMAEQRVSMLHKGMNDLADEIVKLKARIGL